jgi:hypothetical protein
MRLLTAVLILAIMSSCEKKELPAPAYNRGDALTVEIEMTSNYKNQVWYSLSENKVVSANLKSDWDLAFESSVAGTHVLLNGSKSMRAFRTNHTSLAMVNDTAGLEAGGKADTPGGNLDSTAIGNWQANNNVYIINRGYDETGHLQGFYKLKINSVSGSVFTIEYGDVFGTQVYQQAVVKDPAYNVINFSFSTGQQANFEPEKTKFDLCFTQYTHFFTNPFQYYLVTGVLNNSYNTRITKLTDRAFADITINDTLGRVFNTERNAIGYEWKSFDLNTNLYTVNSAICYIIRDSKGFYYKLHFVDFYNAAGVKGYPKFEFRKL